MRRIGRISADRSHVKAGVECRRVALQTNPSIASRGDPSPHPSIIRLIRQIRLIRRPFDIDAGYRPLLFKGQADGPSLPG